MKDESRVHPRYEIDDSAAMPGVGSHRIQNISLGGICIQTPALQEIGAPVDVVLNLRAEGRRIDLQGQVVWVNRDPPEDVGIRWIQLDDDNRQLLTAYIARLREHALSADAAADGP